MTIPLPSDFQHVLTFVETHLIYWVILVALFFEFRYLFQKDRREVIAMSRLGSASRDKKPAYFILLWVLHVIGASVFTLLFLGYFARLIA